jgi:hypothetical protein
MKETLTLLERCQREARENLKELLNHPRTGLRDSSDTNKTRTEIYGIYDDIIAHTLKQAAEALEGMKYREVAPDNWKADYAGNQLEAATFTANWHNKIVTDAQKLIRGELDI